MGDHEKGERDKRRENSKDILTQQTKCRFPHPVGICSEIVENKDVKSINSESKPWIYPLHNNAPKKVT